MDTSKVKPIYMKKVSDGIMMKQLIKFGALGLVAYGGYKFSKRYIDVDRVKEDFARAVRDMADEDTEFDCTEDCEACAVGHVCPCRTCEHRNSENLMACAECREPAIISSMRAVAQKHPAQKEEAEEADVPVVTVCGKPISEEGPNLSVREGQKNKVAENESRPA